LLRAALPAWPAHAHEPEAAPRTISVEGRADVNATPDVLHLTFTIESTKKTAAEAASDNATRAQRLLTALKQLAHEKDSVTTLGYQLQPLYETPEDPRGHGGKAILVGYRAYNEIAVELHAPSRAGELIDAGIAGGADRVADMRFDLADRKMALRQALADAVRDAQTQAATIAQALGVTLGRVRSVSTTPEVIRFPQERFRVAAADTPVEPGDVTVSATVQVVFDLPD
jgi:uncharacterized protein YggE